MFRFIKNYIIIFLLALNATGTMAQWNRFYYFEHYYNKTIYADKKIKLCKIYEEKLTDSIPVKIIVDEQRFDAEGKLCYDRQYYKADTLEGRLLTYYYDSTGRVTDTYWTWIELLETDRFTYTYNKKGHLVKRVEYKKKESDKKYKKVETQQLCYDKIGIWLYTKTDPGGNKTYYQFKSDTTLVKNTKDEDEYHAYVNGLLVEWHFAGLILSYEYDSLKRLVKFTKKGARDVIESEEFTYENGLLISSFEVNYRYDGIIRKRRSYVYEH